jgi:hypothetical protein
MMAIYRIQDGAGRGPWKPGFSHKWTGFRDAAYYERMKPAFKDFPSIHQQIEALPAIFYWGCGCESIDQLRLWFDQDEYSRLKGYGYRAVSMQVDRIIERSQIQVVFAREKALWKDCKAVHLYELGPTK